jgi:hypothetical protein
VSCGVYVAVRGECSLRDTLISGALATRFGGIADRQVPPTLFGAWEWERRFRGSSVPDTLLGPEETGHVEAAAVGWWLRCLPCDVDRGWAPLFLICGTALRPHRLTCHRVGVWWWGGCGRCLLFEICIVDASIFVAKFFRAHGGCLGIRSR